jgi:hypothetical protein
MMTWDVGIPGKEGVSIPISLSGLPPEIWPDSSRYVILTLALRQTIWAGGLYKLQVIFPEGSLTSPPLSLSLLKHHPYLIREDPANVFFDYLNPLPLPTKKNPPIPRDSHPAEYPSKPPKCQDQFLCTFFVFVFCERESGKS